MLNPPTGERANQLSLPSGSPRHRVDAGDMTKAAEKKNSPCDHENQARPEIMLFRGPETRVQKRLWHALHD